MLGLFIPENSASNPKTYIKTVCRGLTSGG
jgi:hypothetical protein